MIWAEIALAILKAINTLMASADRDKLVKLGYDQAFAEQSAKLLSLTQWAKDAREKIAAMDEVAVDDALRRLEPKL